MASCDPQVRRFAIVFGIILTRRSDHQPRQVSMTRLHGLWLEHLGKNKRIPSEMKVSNFVLTSDFTGDISWASWTHAQHHNNLNGHFSPFLLYYYHSLNAVYLYDPKCSALCSSIPWIFSCGCRKCRSVYLFFFSFGTKIDLTSRKPLAGYIYLMASILLPQEYFQSIWKVVDV